MTSDQWAEIRRPNDEGRRGGKFNVEERIEGRSFHRMTDGLWNFFGVWVLAFGVFRK